MVLYVKDNCLECDKIKKWIDENNIEVDIEVADEEISKTVKGFPALKVGEDPFAYIIGREGSQQYLEKGYIHDPKICPYTNKKCIENECEKFIVLKRGSIYQGECVDYMNSLLLIEILTKIDKRGQQNA